MLLEFNELLKVGILSGIIGFALFSASYAAQVWVKRNHFLNSSRRRFAGIGILIGVVGLFFVGFGWIANTFQTRSGVIVPFGITVVTKPPGVPSISIVESDEINEHDVIANFLPPSDQARLAALGIERERVAARRTALESEPLPVDAALDNEMQNIRYEIIQLRRFRQDISNIQYERRIERLDIMTAWAREERELEEAHLNAQYKAEADALNRDIATKEEQRAVKLNSRGVMSQTHLEERVLLRTAAESIASSTQNTVDSLKGRLDTLNDQYRDQFAAFDAILSELGRKAEEIDGQLGLLRAREATLQTMIDDDLARARRVRGHRVAEIEKEEERIKAEMQVIVDGTRIRAPYDGKVIYRHASPSIARAEEPLLIVARTDGAAVDTSAGLFAKSDAAPQPVTDAPRSGFYAQIHMRAAEMEILDGRDQPVTFAVREPVLSRIFSGRLIETHALEHEDGHGLATFHTQLPPDIVARVARDHEPVDIAMVWQPPLLARGEVKIGVALLVVSLLSVAVGLLGRSPGRDRSSRSAGPPAAATPPTAVAKAVTGPTLALAPQQQADPVHTPPPPSGSGALEGRHQHLIRSLAVKLKDDLARGAVEPELVTTLEWMIDRHHVRAVKVLNQEFHGQAATLLGQCNACPLDEHTRSRLRAILHLALPPHHLQDISGPAAQHG